MCLCILALSCNVEGGSKRFNTTSTQAERLNSKGMATHTLLIRTRCALAIKTEKAEGGKHMATI